MNKRNMLALLPAAALVTGIWTVTAQAADLSAAAGFTGYGGSTWRIGISKQWNKRWYESERGYLSGYWDAGYTYWASSKEPGDAHSVSFSPVLTYSFTNIKYQPFVEFGIGVSLFSEKKVDNRNFGSAFNFEDRIGAGITLPGGSRLGLRAIHYSNAGFKKPNDGIESYALFYSRAF